MLKWAKIQKCPLGENVTSWAIFLKNNEMFFWAIKNGFKLHKDDSKYAAEVGNLEILEWFVKSKRNIKSPAHIKAIEKQSLEVVKWLRENTKYNWCAGTTLAAARSGKLDILKWLIEQNIPFHRDFLIVATERGDLEMIQYAVANGCVFEENKIVELALRTKHSHIIEWIVQRNSQKYQQKNGKKKRKYKAKKAVHVE